MTVQAFTYLPPTWGDFLALRTGCPLATIAAVLAYLLTLLLILPGAFRVWLGIAREGVATLIAARHAGKSNH